MHSTPQFPYRRNENNFWPPSGVANAQTFICVTLPYNQFADVGKFSTQRSIKDMKCHHTVQTVDIDFVLPSGKHLRYINAYPFDHEVPANFHRQLIEAVHRNKLDPVSSFQQLTTAGNNRFHAVAKQQSQQQQGEMSIC